MAVAARLSLVFTRWISASVSRRSPKIAVVGSGPAGLFAAGSILRREPSSSIDVFDAAPVPFGLVRYGVAPDHQEVKNCIHGFEKMFNTHEPSGRLSLFCNVRIGSDITIDELSSNYSAVLLAYGAQKPRKLKIPGADATNVITGSEMVSWYSGKPGAAAPLLNNSHVLVIGNGNVALDCARVLCLGGQRLRDKDVPEHVLSALESSAIRTIRIIGRRSAADVSFTIKELREQFRLGGGWKSLVCLSSEEKQQLESAQLKMERPKKRITQVLLDNTGSLLADEEDMTCSFHFNRVPKQIVKDHDGRVNSAVLSRADGTSEVVPAGLVIASLGYEPVILEGLPVNEKGTLALVAGSMKVDMPSGSPVFAAGWCARGPKGVIADSQQGAAAVAQELCQALPGDSNHQGVQSLLEMRKVPFISWKEWLEIDKEERQSGEKSGKIREKIVNFEKYIDTKKQ